MIQTRDDLKYYLLCDKIARNESKDKPSLHGDKIWKFQILQRKVEYYYNNRNNSVISMLLYLIYNRRRVRKSEALGSEIPLNVFAEGLVIWHGQNIIVHEGAKVGRNCTINAGCCIGQSQGEIPVIGDNLEMGIGSKIIGGVNICNDVTIGAGAVIVKSIDEPYTTWGGVPGKCISHNLNLAVKQAKERLAGVIKE